MNSQHWLVFRECSNTKDQKFNCWICRVLLKVLRTVRVVVSRLLLLEELAIWLSSFWMQPDQCNIRGLSNINWKVSVSDWTRAHLTLISKGKIKAVLLFRVWSTLIKWVMKPSKQFWNNTRLTTPIFVLNVMPMKMISSILLKEIESTFLVFMLWTRLTLWLWTNSTF